MEFFEIANITTNAETLQTITVHKLPNYCSEIEKLLHIEHENTAHIYCLWGEFKVNREIINGGIRFSLPECPNALTWTITTGYEPAPLKVVIHCTINRIEHDPDFIESIDGFIQAWKVGLEKSNLS